MNTFDLQPQVEEYFSTYAAEPASEDQWLQYNDMSPEQSFEMLFGYTQENHNNDVSEQGLVLSS